MSSILLTYICILYLITLNINLSNGRSLTTDSWNDDPDYSEEDRKRLVKHGKCVPSVISPSQCQRHLTFNDMPTPSTVEEFIFYFIGFNEGKVYF